MDPAEVGLATTQRTVGGNRSRGLAVHFWFDDQTPRGGLEVAGGDRGRE